MSLAAILDARFPVRTAASLAAEDTRLLAFADRFAAEFERAPVTDPGHTHQWSLLREHAYEAYEGLAQVLDIRFEPACPYLTADDLRADILQQARLVVTTEHSDHPLWSRDDNCVFRVLHDVLPHALHGREFTLRGEVLAFHDHIRRAPPGCELAIYTEIFAYAAIRYTTGEYPPRQKACVFPALYEEYMTTMTA